MRASKMILAIILLAAACSGGEEDAATSEPSTAVASIEAGMCAEHGVLEALCTKCNAALIPVFQAKGDWCERHGFPESICPVCHPERGGRPAEAVSSDEPPADGTKVRFKTKETARLAGIEVEKARASSGTSHVEATVVIVYDAAHEAQVNARAPGVVRAVAADIGAKVRAGSPLATIESADVGADKSRLKAATSHVEVAQANYDRLKGLHTEGIVAEREVLEAKRALDEAGANLEAVRAALGVVESSADGTARYTLVSPLAGVVTRRSITVGRVVGTDEILFEIADPSAMWAEIDIPEIELPRVQTGREVDIAVDGVPGREFHGTLSYVAPEIDPHTRTAKGRVSIQNSEGLLRANMYGRARIAATAPGSAVSVPRAAVQRARSANLVFVRMAEDLFEARRVQVLGADAGWVVVSGRVEPGDDIVTTGSFLLKTETLRESIGAGCCDVE